MAATDSKDLWAGNPVWLSYPCPSIAASPLLKNSHADVAIVGAGISGAVLAQSLAENGYSVIILDKRTPGHGSTTASTALLQYDLDVPLTRLSRDIGEDKAARAWLRSRQSFDRLAEKIEKLHIACERQSALYLAGNVLDAAQLEQEGLARNAIGLTTEYLSQGELSARFGIHRPAALLVTKSMSVDPRQLLAGFLHKAVKDGATIISPATVTDVQSHGGRVCLQTDTGYEIEARHAVFATGYEISKRISLRNKKIASSWAIATKTQPDRLWPGKAHIWEASDPYLYIRVTRDGRVICGGEDEEFSDEETRNALIPEKTAVLEKKLAGLFPHLDTRAAFSWAGCFGETETGLPMIGPIPGLANCYAILAFGGNGITFSQLASEIIGKNMSAKNDPDADLFCVQ